MPRVLLITGRYPPQPGGVAAAARRIAAGIQASGEFRVEVLHPASGLPAGERRTEDDAGVNVHRLGVPADTEGALRLTLGAIEELAGQKDRAPIRIFHGFYLMHQGYMAAFAARYLSGAASVASARGNDVDRAMLRPDQLPFLRWTLEHADAVTCVTEDLRDKCRALADVALERIVAIANAVDSDFFHPLPRPLPNEDALLKQIGWKGEVLLGFFGELRAKKGPEALLAALAAAQRENACRLVLVGGVRGSDEARWRELRESTPFLDAAISEVPYVTGRETLRDWYNLVDVALFPSVFDGMPNAALEAMACERPIVASDAGGLRELVRDGETGYLASRHDPVGFARRAVEVLRRPAAEAAACGARAREFVRTRHSLAAETAAYLRLYRSLL